MNDRSLEALAHYGIEIQTVRRGRGVMLCETGEGLFIFKEYNGTKARMEYLETLLKSIEQLEAEGMKLYIDCPIRNKEGELITAGEDGGKYIVKKWFAGRECDVKQIDDIYAGARALAYLHKRLNHIDLQIEIAKENKIPARYESHNREIKRARNYIRSKNKRNEFEMEIQKCYDRYYEMCEKAAAEISEACKGVEDKKKQITHGNYNYHHILFCEGGMAVVNFESSRQEMQILDLYNYLRKVCEKYNWNEHIGMRLLEFYDEIKPIEAEERRILKALLAYPEKYWKIVNHYFNSSKSFIPDKSLQKLESVIGQEEVKASFVLKI